MSSSPSPAVFLAVPCYGSLVAEALDGLMFATLDKYVARWTLKVRKGSLLPLIFNRLWCDCLNTRGQHGWNEFAMHHSDIQAPPGWLDVMVQERRRVGADVLSCVVPIKDSRGITSTGIRHKSGKLRRLTMTEACNLPETFDVRTAGGSADEHLVVNTGLWVCDMTAPWVERFPGFRLADGIIKTESGKRSARCVPEDWGFSDWCHDQGLSVCASRKVAVKHHGNVCYENSHPWGTCLTDEGDEE